MFVGRKAELKVLQDSFKTGKSELVVIYGRRRIGKSSLVARFAKGKSGFLGFEGIEGERTLEQIKHFSERLRKQTNDPLLKNVAFKSWEDVFSYLTERILKARTNRSEKMILFFDELSWMASGRTKLIGLLKYFWDNHWKEQQVMLILCGSIATFMVKKVIKSKALYGRINVELLLQGLEPYEASNLFSGKRSREEILKYFFVFGGVPKYLEEIDLNSSFAQNINRLCFAKTSPMTREVERIFYNHFKEHQIYLKIVRLLNQRICTMQEISRHLSIASGGGLRLYLQNLEDTEIIRSYVPYGKKITSKLRKYTLADEYLIFYYKFIQPNLQTIKHSRSLKLFENLAGESFDKWLGFAFERYCLKHAGFLAAIMGFEEEVILAVPFYAKKDQHFQIDLLYQRSDKVLTICEIKHQNKPLTTKVIPEVEMKCASIPLPRGFTIEKALISLYGPDQALRDSGYFHHIVTLDDILPG